MHVQIENQAYPVNVDALNTVFSPYGFVQKIAIFDKNGQSQVRAPSVGLSLTDVSSKLLGNACGLHRILTANIACAHMRQ